MLQSHLGINYNRPQEKGKTAEYRKGKTQNTHRVAMATFWATFYHDGEISPAW
jgi:hypothetical protein